MALNQAKADQMQERLLQEMVREAERVIDAQLKGIEELEDKSEEVIKLTVLGVALGLTMGSIVASGEYKHEELQTATVVVLGVGLASSFVALYFAVDAYTALKGRRHAFTNPRIADLPRRHKTPGADLIWHLANLLEGYVPVEKANLELMDSVIKSRKVGIRILAWTAVPLYFIALVFVATLSLANR